MTHQGRVAMGVIQRRWVVLLLAVCFLALVPALAGTQEIVRVGGVGSALGVMKIIGSAFEAANPGIRVQVVPSLGSSGGIKALFEGALDLALSGRPLKEEEKARGALSQELVRTPFIFVTHLGVAKDAVTTREVEQIYAGELTAWPDGSRIRLILRPTRESDSLILLAISPALEQAHRAAVNREGMIIAITDQENVERLARIPGSFGQTTLTQLMSEKLDLKVLAYNGVKPSVKALASGEYKLAKIIFLVTRNGTTSPAAQKFVQFLHTGKARKLLAEAGNLVSNVRPGH